MQTYCLFTPLQLVYPLINLFGKTSIYFCWFLLAEDSSLLRANPCTSPMEAQTVRTDNVTEHNREHNHDNREHKRDHNSRRNRNALVEVAFLPEQSQRQLILNSDLRSGNKRSLVAIKYVKTFRNDFSDDKKPWFNCWDVYEQDCVVRLTAGRQTPAKGCAAL